MASIDEEEGKRCFPCSGYRSRWGNDGYHCIEQVKEFQGATEKGEGVDLTRFGIKEFRVKIGLTRLLLF